MGSVQAAQLGVTEELNAEEVSAEDASSQANGEGDSGGISWQPGALDSRTVEAQVSEEALRGAEHHEPVGEGHSLCLLAFAFGNRSYGHLLIYKTN